MEFEHLFVYALVEPSLAGFFALEDADLIHLLLSAVSIRTERNFQEF